MSQQPISIDWDALETAVERNAPDTESFLDRTSGQVLTLVTGDPETPLRKRQIAENISNFVRVEPASSREQYRWMEKFVSSVSEPQLRERLIISIDGKGAFRRFKDVLMGFPIDRERWFAFRSERLRIAIEAWLDAHGLKAQEREEWRVPSADQVKAAVERHERAQPARRSRAAAAETTRTRLRELVDLLPVRELELALEFMEFLRERRPLPRPRARTIDKAASNETDSERELDRDE